MCRDDAWRARGRRSTLRGEIVRGPRGVKVGQTVDSSASALTGSGALLDAILANLGDGIVVFAPGGRLIYANAAAASLLGIDDAEELVGARSAELLARYGELRDERGAPLAPEDLPSRRVLAGGPSQEAVVRFRPPAGDVERASLVRAVPVHDEQGSLQYVITVFRDVTAQAELAEHERRAATEIEALYQEAHRASALLDSLYDSAPIGLGFWDRELRYVRVNEALAAINELPEAEHVGKTLEEVVPQLAHVLRPIAQGVLDRREAVVALEIAAGTPTAPEAERHWLASYYPVLAADGTALGVGAIVEEVTDRRRAEQRVDLQLAVTRILADAETAAEAVPLVLETVGVGGGFDVACYWPADADEPRRTWAREGIRADGFLAMTERASFAPPLVPGVVARRREPLWLEELQPELMPRASVAHAEGLRSGVVLPVEVEGELMGVLELYSTAERTRDEALLQTLVALARQTAQFLRRKRAESERGESLQRERQARADAEAAAATLRKLGRVAEAALERLALDDLLPALLERIVEVLEADTATILLLGDDGRLHVRASVGLEAQVPHAVAIPLGEGMAGRVAATRTPLLVPDLSAVDLVSPMLRERGINSLVAIPLVVEDEVIGVVHAGSEAYAQFADDDARLLELIADRIALAINHAALADAERRAQERLRFLADASTLLASSLDVERTLQQLGSLAAQRIADWCVIHLLDDDGSVRPVVIAHRDAERAARAWADARSAPDDREPPSAVAQALLAGEPQLLRDAASLPEDAPERAQGAHTGIVVALVARGRPLGTITLVRDVTPGAYEPADVEFATDLARRAAAAVDNARLFQDAERARDRVGLLADASALLGASLDVERTLDDVGSLVVGRVADWCTIYLAEEDGLRLVTVAAPDLERAARIRPTIARPRQPSDAAVGVAHVVRSGRAQLHPTLPDELRDEVARELGVHTVLIVPLTARGRTVGAMAWARSETPDAYDSRDLALAVDLAGRVAAAVDNAQLYRAAEERAQAARVLASVGDGVFLVDRTGIVRTWNRAAAAATGLRPRDVVERAAVDAIPGWAAVASHVPVAPLGTTSVRAESLPLDLGDRELWLSVHGVAVPDGIVYAFRDLTEERALETMRTEFVSTVSHELRTPLAAIYGAAMTLRRSDVALDESQRARLLDVVSGEADRLARTVNDILWASRLDTGSLHVTISSCDPYELARDVVEAQRAHLDEQHRIELATEDDLPAVAGDPDKVARVLINLVDNAVKYSPDGGVVRLRVRRFGGRVRFSVVDEGLGIPPPEQRRVFEKFYRLDPNMTRGVGGTGLGLYLCRELVHRMDGRIWVESRGLGAGSTFHVELPVAGDPVSHLA